MKLFVDYHTVLTCAVVTFRVGFIRDANTKDTQGHGNEHRAIIIMWSQYNGC